MIETSPAVGVKLAADRRRVQELLRWAWWSVVAWRRARRAEGLPWRSKQSP